MIYNHDFFHEEMSRSFLSEGMRVWRVIAYSVLLTLISFFFSLVMSSIEGTIVTEALDVFSHKTSFSLLSILNLIVFTFVAGYMFVYYDAMTFSSINSNRTYMLVKMGMSRTRIIVSRLLATLFFATSVYVVSFFVAALCAVVFNYDFMILTIPGLFILGLIIVNVIAIVILCLSLFIKNRNYCLLTFIAIVILEIVYACLGGFYYTISDADLVSQILPLFDVNNTNLFLIGLCLVVIAMLLLSLIKCYAKVDRYIPSKFNIGNTLTIDYKTGKVIKEKKDLTKTRDILARTFVYITCSLMLFLGISTNIYSLVMDSQSIDDMVKDGTKIALIYKHDDMHGEIERNDYVTFMKVSEDYDINVGDVIYYKDHKNVTKVSKVMSIDASNNYYVDVTSYDDEESISSLEVQLTRKEILGIKVDVNRYLGAWMVFNNEFSGKLIMFGVPIIWLIFYDRLKVVSDAYIKAEEDSIGLTKSN